MSSRGAAEGSIRCQWAKDEIFTFGSEWYWCRASRHRQAL